MIRVEKLLVILIIALLATSKVTLAADSANNAGVDPHAISLYNLGLSAYKQGSPESAIIFFKRAVDIDPNLADAQYNLGVLYQSERRLKEAVPRYKEALRVKPDDADTHYQLALALIDLNQLSEARQNLMAIAPNSSHFSEAQKKVAMIDSQLANPAVSSSTTTTGQETVEQNNSNLSVAANSLPTNTVVNTSVTDAPGVNNQQFAAAASQTSTVTTTTITTPSVSTPPVSNVTTQVEASSGNNPIAVIDGASAQVIANGFSAPSGLAFDRIGNLYVANFVTNVIDRISPDGRKSQFSTNVNLKGPIGLICDNDNNIYVANYLAGTVTRINPAGIAQVIVSGLKKPYYLAMDKDGNLFVSQQEDNSIVRVNFGRGGANTLSQLGR